jgi:hypothetical protein
LYAADKAALTKGNERLTLFTVPVDNMYDASGERRGGRAMASKALLATTLFIAAQTLSGIATSHASDLLWEVENPYRFFKRGASFEVQEKAFNAVRGAPGQPLPTNILWRVERRLNDPDCKDPSTPASCLATARPGFATSRLGWAAQTVDLNCYDRNARPRHYMVLCDRQYSWGSVKEDYILPDAHTVAVHIAPEQLAAAGAGDCVWTWQPRSPAGNPRQRSRPAPPSSSSGGCRSRLSEPRPACP